MKLPVMIQVFRDADAELLRLDDSLPCTWSSGRRGRLAFEVDKADDSGLGRSMDASAARRRSGPARADDHSLVDSRPTS